MAEQGVEVGKMEQAVQQPAVPQVPLGMLDEPLRRLLHIGRKPPPKKRTVGDLEIVPRGRRRDAQTAGDIGMIDDGSGEAGEVLQKKPKPVLVEPGKESADVTFDVGLDVLRHPHGPKSVCRLEPGLGIASAEPVVVHLLDVAAGPQREELGGCRGTVGQKIGEVRSAGRWMHFAPCERRQFDRGDPAGQRLRHAPQE